ncbi:two-component system sensor histidine kinase QseC [Pseudochelatococcus lubricantis]|uniref:histidine kinase n=1 Tax=Pseudochelatococcus lubricantis TaxID=1538102 RepID=A0ABX0V3M6_9HYPH|nr:ATP-binding protein [Pseudochelatococcus lubricantis]NIJ59816.1 two-component system sensor histidine kinase QseC [Pseudochelatococcus lubricantis]
MRSIGTRLFVILGITTGLVWLSAVAWIFVSTRAEIEHVLDARLMEAGRMVNSLIVSQEIDVARAQGLKPPFPARVPAGYDRQLSCQIWSLQGVLIGRSEGAPEKKLSEHRDGFSQTVIDGETWRVFAVENAALGVRVLVGDNLRIRDRLVNDVIRGLLLPTLLILPALAGLIWFSIRQGLAPLDRIARNLSARPASDLSPLDSADTAREIAPVVQSLNGLFARVAGQRERERHFTAFAAHELRTPLAGLKTQAQVALASGDPAIRDRALRQIAVGVDRTGRLVRQLLDISAIEAGERGWTNGPTNPGAELKALANELPHAGKALSIAVAPELEKMRVAMDPDLFRLAARNLLENAINHSPPGGTIACGLAMNGADTIIVIEDAGPGIPTDELDQVKERFFRGRNRAPVGSGLGLAIAELALEQAGCSLLLRNAAAGGLVAGIAVPATLVRGFGKPDASPVSKPPPRLPEPTRVPLRLP